MIHDRDYAKDSAYTLALASSAHPDAASDISITLDDGADVVIELGSRTIGRISAYLTVDEAEDLSAALAEILQLPSDRTAGMKPTAPVLLGGEMPSRSR